MNKYNKIQNYNNKCENIMQELVILLNKKYNKDYYPELTNITLTGKCDELIIFKIKQSSEILKCYKNYFKILCNYDVDIINLILNYVKTYQNIKNLLDTCNTNYYKSYYDYLYMPLDYISEFFYQSTTKKENYELLILKEKYNNIDKYYLEKYKYLGVKIKKHYLFIFNSLILRFLNQ